MNNEIEKAAALIGAYGIAKACGVRGPSVYKWIKNGRLPRTEWTGETDYATKIEQACDGKVTRQSLLQKPQAQTA